MDKDLYAVILAGGSGSRLWPLSREMYPKQLLKVSGDNTLFQSTFLRLAESFDDKNIFTITNIKHAPNINIQLEAIKERFCRTAPYKIITEPVGRNTAPAIALATKYVQKTAGHKVDPIILFAPSDHLVANIENFSQTIEEAIKLAKEGYIVTCGIVPNQVDTGFGYIKTKKDKKIRNISPNGFKAAEFVEKPDFKTAKEYVESGKYYYNSGIFIFKASVIMKEIKKYTPEIIKILKASNVERSIPSIEYQKFKDMPDVSIDYAVMENSKKIALLPLDCGWNDLGSWEAIYDVSKKDKNGNYILGNVIDLGSKNSMIYSTSKLVTTIGLKDTVVVETEDALLVCDKARTQDVKKIYNTLKTKNNSAIMVHKTVYRPWGYYTVMQEGEGFLTKCIVVNSGAKLSLQKHFHRSEHWVVLEGKAFVIKDGQNYELNPGESIDIGVEEIHSLQNPYEKPVKILEVQKGDILDEDDIERLEDMYGRV